MLHASRAPKANTVHEANNDTNDDNNNDTSNDNKNLIIIVFFYYDASGNRNVMNIYIINSASLYIYIYI